MSDHSHHHDHQEEGSVLSDVALRVRTLESLLTEKGLVDPKQLDATVETYERKIGPRYGARVVARAWVDAGFKERLLRDACGAIEEIGLDNPLGTGPLGGNIVALENTPEVHNMVVCTLCSCYPTAILGLPPVWYKSAPYRSRAVIDPRGVLREFGLELPDETEVRVWDSTADLRYLVLPQRPAGTDDWSEERLAEIVTRDSMVGVAVVSL